MDAVVEHPCFCERSQKSGLSSKRQHGHVGRVSIWHPSLFFAGLRQGEIHFALTARCPSHINAGDLQSGHDRKKGKRVNNYALAPVAEL